MKNHLLDAPLDFMLHLPLMSVKPVNKYLLSLLSMKVITATKFTEIPKRHYFTILVFWNVHVPNSVTGNLALKKKEALCRH